MNRYEPGDCITIDQFVVKVPGRLSNTAGKESLQLRYTGGTIVVDLASGFIFLRIQVSLGAGETVIAKEEFECFLSTYGITAKRYRGDNGVFKATLFTDHCICHKQEFDFSSVGAHHQNANVERTIQTVSYCARSMMINAAIHWPDKGSD